MPLEGAAASEIWIVCLDTLSLASQVDRHSPIEQLDEFDEARQQYMPASESLIGPAGRL